MKFIEEIRAAAASEAGSGDAALANANVGEDPRKDLTGTTGIVDGDALARSSGSKGGRQKKPEIAHVVNGDTVKPNGDLKAWRSNMADGFSAVSGSASDAHQPTRSIDAGSTEVAKLAAGLSKTEVVLKKLRNAKGATVETLMEVTGWQAHSVRGFLSGTVKKKLRLKLTSEVGKDGLRRYRIEMPTMAR